MHADAAAGGTSEGRQPTVDFHRAHVCHAYAGDRAPAQDRAISHANRAYEVFGRHSWLFWQTVQDTLSEPYVIEPGLVAEWRLALPAVH